MEDNQINYIRPAFGVMLIGLMIASFTQSCGVTKASISHTIMSVVADTPIGKPKVPVEAKKDSEKSPAARQSNIHSHIDTGLVKPVIVPSKIIDSPSLYNERLSLENQRRIIDMLISKDNEVKRLNGIIAKLSAKTMVTDNQKIDAVSMEAVWRLGQYILTAGCVIIILMFINILILLNNKKYRTSQTIS